MIRAFAHNDIDEIINIWYMASVKAHPFVPESFWLNAREDMKNIYLPQALTFTLVESNQIIGFLSLCANQLAAIFITPNFQGQGYGEKLLNHAFSLRSQIELNVYADNLPSIGFYKKHGFKIIKEKICPHTNAKEFVMRWIKS